MSSPPPHNFTRSRSALDPAEPTPNHAPPVRSLSRSHHRRTARRLLAAFAFLLTLACAAVLATALWLRHAMRASLPQLDGTLAVAGLSAPVTVTRDAQGVPSIRAANLDDLLFAQGYITAQDRLWQMDILRRHAAGDLAAILGPSLVEHDRRQRYLQIRAAADRAAAALPPGQLHQLQAYAHGVNAFIVTHEGNANQKGRAAAPDRLPVEFHLLHYTPAPWSPRDSLLVALAMTEDLSTEFPQKLDREELSAHLPANLLADLYPVGSWRDRPPSQPPPDLTVPQPEIEQVPLDRSQSFNRPPQAPLDTPPQQLLATFTAFNSNRCESCRAGSNNWVVAGSRSASGAPLLSNDMHLSLSVPDIWYEASLHIDPSTTGGPFMAQLHRDMSGAAAKPLGAAVTPFDVEGFTLPGVPFVIAGRNATVAWGFTNTGADVQDLRIEHLRGAGAHTEFERPDGSWALVTHHVEHIRVRGGRDVTLDVLTTTHSLGATTIETPILSPLLPSAEHRALSLAWTIYDPSTITTPLYAIDAAPDAASLVAAFAAFANVSQNLVYADAHHIGYHMLGRIPIRGPAIQRPRAPLPFVLPDRTPEEDEQDESGSPQAAPQPTPQQIPQQPTIAYTIGSPISPVPVDALDPTQVWSGYIPYDALPSVIDPPSGVIATANARVAPDDFPYFLANDWADAYRVERIYKLLESSTSLTPADMLRIQTDVHSEFDLLLAQRLAYAVDHASPALLARDPRRLRQAADLLRHWNGNLTPGDLTPGNLTPGDLTPNSAAAAIVSAAHAQLWPMLLVPQIRAFDHTRPGSPSPAALASLYTWSEKNSALEQLLQHTPARWLPAGYATWDDLLTAALDQGLRRSSAPANLASWRYGAVHPVEIAHPLFGSHGWLSKLLGRPTGTGLHPNGGDSTTIDATGLHFGPSERFTADLAGPTTANLPTGESANPLSAWYLDQFLPWLHGTTFPLPLDRPAITHTLTLTP